MLAKFILWCYQAPVLEWFRNAKYAIPVLQSFHLMGLTAVLGVICIISIRLLGLGFLKLSLTTLWRELSRWFLAALAMTITAGIIIAIIDPTRYLANTPFRIKMAVLATAILYHYTIFRKVVRSAPDSDVPRTTGVRALTGCLGLLLWFSVGWAGRMIAFFN
jgi:hypothetical protein